MGKKKPPGGMLQVAKVQGGGTPEGVPVKSDHEGSPT